MDNKIGVVDVGLIVFIGFSWHKIMYSAVLVCDYGCEAPGPINVFLIVDP